MKSNDPAVSNHVTRYDPAVSNHMTTDDLFANTHAALPYTPVNVCGLDLPCLGSLVARRPQSRRTLSIINKVLVRVQNKRYSASQSLESSLKKALTYGFVYKEEDYKNLLCSYKSFMCDHAALSEREP